MESEDEGIVGSGESAGESAEDEGIVGSGDSAGESAEDEGPRISNSILNLFDTYVFYSL